MRASLRFSCLLTLAFAALAAWLAWHHEPWRDEMQAWLIARDSPDLRSLALSGHYEGSPPLWLLLLRPLTLFTHRPEAMQLLQGTLAVAAFFLLCRFAPFTRGQKVLLLFNYYLLYEYGTVCRQYLLGALLLGIACAFFPRHGRERPWIFAAALVGAALTSVYSLILAVALAAACWGHRAIVAWRPPAGAAPVRVHPLPLMAVIAGVAVAIASMLPAPDALYAPANGWITQWDNDRVTRAACEFVNAHFLLPRPGGFFWIPAWLTDFGWPQVTAVALALPLLVASAWSLRRTRGALLFYLAGTAGTLAFIYVKYLGFTRHAGFLFLVFLFGCWLQETLRAADPVSASPSPARPDRGMARRLLTALLSIQAVTGIWALCLETARPFSTGHQAARAILDRHLGQAPLAAWPDSAGTVVAGWLDRTVYLPQSARRGSFTRWNTARNEHLTDAEALAQAEQSAGPGPLVIVLDHTLPGELIRTHGLFLVGAFTGALASFEDYYVYARSAPSAFVGPPARLNPAPPPFARRAS
jgi:hypothetical protein